MRQAALILTLSADAVFSARAATVGGHAGLDQIPGAALLGWAAGQLYGSGGREAYVRFHSGEVRFSNGFPLIEVVDANGKKSGKIAFPVPQVLTQKKAERGGVQNGRLAPANLRVYPARFGNGIQPEALKDMHVTADGEVLKRSTGYRMKTAIANGRAAEAQLFGYEHLRAGRSFVAFLEADDDVPSALFEQLRRLFDERRLSLGRSRHAEFGGQVFCRVQEDAGEIIWPVPGKPDRKDPRRITLWLLSDLAVDDGNGTPSLAPPPELLGLPAGKFLESDSVIAVRRYAPFNNYLRRAELERSVIAAGSVLRYELNAPAVPSELARAGGIGLHRETGLGRVWINPQMLADDQPRPELDSMGEFQIVPARREGGSRIAADYASGMIAWLEARSQESRIADKCDKLVEAWFGDVQKLYTTAGAVIGQKAVGPSPSQWGRVKAVCDNAALSLHEVIEMLVGQDDKDDDAPRKPKGKERPICRDDPTWEHRGQIGGNLLSFQAWTADRLNDDQWKNEDKGGLRALKLTLGKLAERAQTLAKELVP